MKKKRIDCRNCNTVDFNWCICGIKGGRTRGGKKQTEEKKLRLSR